MSTKLLAVDNIQFLLDYGIDVNSKTFMLNDGINEDSLEHVMTALRIFRDEPCMMYINSGGGEVSAGLAMYDMIKLHGQVAIVVTGVANSMASIVLQAGAQRLMTLHSTMMIHQGYIEPDVESRKNIEAYLKLSDLNDEKCDRILLEKIQTKVPSYSWAKFRKTTQFDNYLTATQAIGIGLADGVLEP